MNYFKVNTLVTIDKDSLLHQILARILQAFFSTQSQPGPIKTWGTLAPVKVPVLENSKPSKRISCFFRPTPEDRAGVPAWKNANQQIQMGFT